MSDQPGSKTPIGPDEEPVGEARPPVQPPILSPDGESIYIDGVWRPWAEWEREQASQIAVENTDVTPSSGVSGSKAPTEQDRTENGSVTCPSCWTANDTATKFCCECGGPLVSPTMAAAPGLAGVAFAATSPAFTPLTDGLIARAKRNPGVVAGLTAALVVLLGLGAYTVVKDHKASHTVKGNLDLTGSDNVNASGSSISGCSGTGGYDDLTVGAEVRITDGSGKTIAVGNADVGTYNDSSSTCTFTFSVDNVPDADIYEVSVGNSSRGGPHYTKAQMGENGWNVSLSIGS